MLTTATAAVGPVPSGAFADGALEAAFRLDRLPGDRRLAATLITIGASITALLGVVDLAAVGSRPGMGWLLPVRAVAVLLGVTAAWLAARARTAGRLDAVALGWALTL